jgi:hypothetical protein
MKERRKLEISNDLLLNWFLRGSEGNKQTFFYLRAFFASHLASVSVFQLILGSQLVPSVLFFDDRQKVCIPGSLDGMTGIVELPLSDQIQRLLPKFVLKGSFSTSWMAAVNSISKTLTKLALLLNTFVAEEKQQKVPAASVLARVKQLAMQETTDTRKTDDQFQFAVMDHLIETSNNAFHAQAVKVGWV